MGYWQRNDSKRRLWFDPVDNKWKRDGPKWVPSKKQPAIFEPPPTTIPPQRTLAINWQFNQLERGYPERTQCTDIKVIAGLVQDQDYTGTGSFYNAIYPLQPAFPDTQFVDLDKWSEPVWSLVQAESSPPDVIPIRGSWQEARIAAEQPPYVSWFNNPSEPVPLGHKDNLGQVGDMDPQYLGTNTLTNNHPILMVNWTRMAETPNDVRKVTLGMSSSYTADGEEPEPYYAVWPMCFDAGGFQDTADPTDYDLWRWEFVGISTPSPGEFWSKDQLVPAQYVQGLDGSFQGPKVTTVSYEYTLRANNTTISHDWEYFPTGNWQVDIHRVTRTFVSDPAAEPVEIFLTENEAPVLDPEIDTVNLVEEGIERVQYFHYYELTSADGQKAIFEATVEYNLESQLPPLNRTVTKQGTSFTVDLADGIEGPWENLVLPYDTWSLDETTGILTVAFDNPPTETWTETVTFDAWSNADQSGRKFNFTIIGEITPVTTIGVPEIELNSSMALIGFPAVSNPLDGDTAQLHDRFQWDNYQLFRTRSTATSPTLHELQMLSYYEADAPSTQYISRFSSAADKSGTTYRRFIEGFGSGRTYLDATPRSDWVANGAVYSPVGIQVADIPGTVPDGWMVAGITFTLPAETEIFWTGFERVITPTHVYHTPSAQDVFVADTVVPPRADLFGGDVPRLGPGGWNMLQVTEPADFYIPKTPTVLKNLIQVSFQGGLNTRSPNEQFHIGANTGGQRITQKRMSFFNPAPGGNLLDDGADPNNWQFRVGGMGGRFKTFVGFIYETDG